MCDLLAFEADRRAVNITINRWVLKGLPLISLNHFSASWLLFVNLFFDFFSIIVLEQS